MLDNPKQFLKSLPNKPGVYQMLDADGQILYVGKAKNLKKRVSSYFRATNHPKTKLFMSKVERIDTIIASSENAALLLESNLIKEKRPRYNTLFKDDKSFPYLLLSNHKFPRLTVVRGEVDKKKGEYFGPFPDAGAVNFILSLLQKIFKVRVCKDSYMRNRSRPCMLYQIKLCSAPCVGHINEQEYALQIKLIKRFLSNKADFVVKELTRLMEEASERLAYEQASNYRDQIVSVRKIQSEQAMTKAEGNYDVVAIAFKDFEVCVNVLFVRNGWVLGNKNYFPKVYNFNLSSNEILSDFLVHYYLQRDFGLIVPDKILLNVKILDRESIEESFLNRLKKKVIVSSVVKGADKELLLMSEANALNGLNNRLIAKETTEDQLLEFKNSLGLKKVVRHIECFDVSHNMGEATVASCVVFKEFSSAKSDYRRFNIKTAQAGDDYMALKEALFRRYRSIEILPDMIIVDGGLGQLNVAAEVLKSLDIIKHVVLMGVAKGEGRKSGLEKFYIYGGHEGVDLLPQSKIFRYIQKIRDEAHRFAITGHRRQMRSSRNRSLLENIPGIGKSKRNSLIKHFGGVAELKSVGVNDLSKVKGIGSNLAKIIYDYLHE